MTANLREGRRSRISIKNAQVCQGLGLKGENYNLVGIDHRNVLKATNIDIITKIEKQLFILLLTLNEAAIASVAAAAAEADFLEFGMNLTSGLSVGSPVLLVL